MSYKINLTNGKTLIPGGLQDGTIDTTHTSLVLIGKDYAGYGEFLNENFVKLLENFASTIGPSNPLEGQLWWDETNNVLRVWSGTTWKISTGATSSPVNNPPIDLSGIGGDLWFDTTNNQLKVYTGAKWIIVGPVANTAVGNSGAVPTIMSDTGNGSHIVIQFLFNGVVYAIISKDTFSSLLTGFPVVRSGLTFSNSVSPTLGINTQDSNPTPNTLVQRTDTGGITATSIVGTAITATTVTTSGTISGSFNGKLTGDVVASSISSSNIITGGITASSGFTGVLLTPNQPNITGLGTVVNLNANGVTNLNGSAYLNGYPIAVDGGPANFSSINNTPIGNAVPSSGDFTFATVNAGLAPVTEANATISLGTRTQYWSTIYATGGNIATINSTTGTFSDSVNTNTVHSVTGLFSGVVNASEFDTNGGINASVVNAVNGTFSGAVNSGSVTSGTGTFTTVNSTNLNLLSTITAPSGVFVNISVTDTAIIKTGRFTSVNSSGTVTAGSINAGASTFSGDVSATGFSTGGTIHAGTFTGTNINVSNYTIGSSIVPAAGGINLGSSGTPFNILYGKATSAIYADLAERFAADAVYPPGTVMELGGTAEVTQSMIELSDNVFGVVSTDPAYLMNADAGLNDTHPAIAFVGRVPVRVIGLINKNDRLVSAGNGLARSGLSSEITPFNVIGRALENKNDLGEGVIEAIVRVNI